MFIFRTESKTSGTIKALLTVALGVLLIATEVNVMTWIVQIVATIIMALGIIPLVQSLLYPAMRPYAPRAAYRIVVAILVYMLAGPIGGIIRYILGILLILFGVSRCFFIWNVGKKHSDHQSYTQFEDNSIDEQ
jgi:hypothetical protein